MSDVRGTEAGDDLWLKQEDGGRQGNDDLWIKKSEGSSFSGTLSVQPLVFGSTPNST